MPELTFLLVLTAQRDLWWWSNGFASVFFPEHDAPEESLLLDHAASPRDSEVPSSISPSSFVLIANQETFCLPSPKFAVRPRVGLLPDRRELAPNRLDGFSRPASVRPHRTPLSCNPLPAPFFVLRGLSERCEPSQPLPVPIYGSARDYAVRPSVSAAALATDQASAATHLSSCSSSPQRLAFPSRPVSSPSVSRPRFIPGSVPGVVLQSQIHERRWKKIFLIWQDLEPYFMPHSSFAKYVPPCMVRVAQTHKHGFVRFTQASPEKLDSATDRGRLTTRESSHGSGALPIPFLVSGGESASVTGDRNLIPGLG